MPEIKLQPYMVALSFADGGPLFLNAVIADNPITATAMVTVDCLRHTGTDKPLLGAVCGPLMPGFIAMAQKILRGDAPAASVVSLVQTKEQSEVQTREQAESFGQLTRCPKHPGYSYEEGSVCAECWREKEFASQLPPLPPSA